MAPPEHVPSAGHTAATLAPRVPVRRIYLAATGMNRGKTTTSLGLLAALIGRGLATGFTKPVGQRYAIVDDIPADEDAILVRAVYSLADPLSAMSPVHIPRGFTRAYIRGEVVEDLGARIVAAFEVVSKDRDVVLIEGTGHAGVGAVIGLSNAEVARMLSARAVIVSEGGVGRPIDEIVLNRALFARHGVDVVGAIVNKVDVEAQPSLPAVLEAGLARHGIPLLGVLPYRPLLSNPTLSMLCQQLEGEVLHPGPDLDRPIERVDIGAMQAGHLLDRLGPGSLLIVPGDREDLLQALVTVTLMGQAGGPWSDGPTGLAGAQDAPVPRHPGVAGLVLTGEHAPPPRVVAAIRSADLFAMRVAEDTYRVASEVHDLLVKTHPKDRDKIALIQSLVAEHLDVDRILALAVPDA
ncbi:MAG TPA: AAA family ATPase [Candidatus Acidoferrales bacterium]|nr:AAA family ATPase [Candidatus Acidoferrales bacterium]